MHNQTNTRPDERHTMFTIYLTDADDNTVALDNDLDASMVITIDTTRVTDVTAYLRTVTDPTNPATAYYTNDAGEIVTTTVSGYQVIEGTRDLTADISELVWK